LSIYLKTELMIIDLFCLGRWPQNEFAWHFKLTVGFLWPTWAYRTASSLGTTPKKVSSYEPTRFVDISLIHIFFLIQEFQRKLLGRVTHCSICISVKYAARSSALIATSTTTVLPCFPMQACLCSAVCLRSSN
jgi:hypothetical protein